MNEVERWYDEEYDEWSRLERHKIEFDITRRFLDEYITGQHLQVFDIGGGPGRYSIYLAQKGHKVILLDLSRRNIEIAKIKAAQMGVDLENFIHGDALNLGDMEQKFDIILLMGPLYHLVDEKDRKRAVEGALSVLKPGGLIFASFISCYAPIQDTLKNLYQIENANTLLGFLENGHNAGGTGFTTAYFTSSSEARGLMEGFGLEELAFAGVENILCSREDEINRLNMDQYQKWLEIGYRLSTDDSLFGASEHFLYIGRKTGK